MVVSRELGVQGVIMGGWEIVKVSLHSSLSVLTPLLYKDLSPLHCLLPTFSNFVQPPPPNPNPKYKMEVGIQFWEPNLGLSPKYD